MTEQFDGSLNFIYAKELEKSPRHFQPDLAEAIRRNVTGRAYYASYSVLHAYSCNILSATEIIDLGVSGTLHSELPKYLKRLSDEDHKRLGTSLKTLRKWRTRADYEHSEKFSANKMKASMVEAEKIFNILHSLDPISYPKR